MKLLCKLSPPTICVQSWQKRWRNGCRRCWSGEPEIWVCRWVAGTQCPRRDKGTRRGQSPSTWCPGTRHRNGCRSSTSLDLFSPAVLCNRLLNTLVIRKGNANRWKCNANRWKGNANRWKCYANRWKCNANRIGDNVVSK